MFEKIVNNCNLYKVEEKKITDAEIRMGIPFPKDLRNFYMNYGYGFVKNEAGAINRIISPLGCADIRLHDDVYEYDLDLEMYKDCEENTMIFFEVNEGVYISIGINDGKIYFTERCIADSLEEFLEKIVNPDFWVEG